MRIYTKGDVDSRSFIAKAAFRIRAWLRLPISGWRKAWLRTQGMSIGKGTSVPQLFVTWPHKVSIGERCRIEHHVYFHYDGIYSSGRSIRIGDRTFVGANCEFNISESICIGDDCLIASGCRFVDHNHGTQRGAPMNSQPCTHEPIVIGRNVWIGANAVILQGVHIGDGAVVAAGAVVTRSIPADTLAGGVPARVIRQLLS